MYAIPHTKPAKALTQPSPKKQPSKALSAKALSTWKPQQTSLTREEIRAIILEQLG